MTLALNEICEPTVTVPGTDMTVAVEMSDAVASRHVDRTCLRCRAVTAFGSAVGRNDLVCTRSGESMCQLGDSVEYEHRCTQTDPSVGELNGFHPVETGCPLGNSNTEAQRSVAAPVFASPGTLSRVAGAEIRETDLHGAQGGRGTVESDSAAERSGNIVRPGIREDVAERRDTIDHVDRISDRRARVRELDGATGRLRFNRCLQIYGTAGPGGRRDGHRCRRSHIGGRHPRCSAPSKPILRMSDHRNRAQ